MNDRTLGYYSCSIATSLAIEGLTLTGEYDDATKKPPILQYDALWINLRTLVRNAYEAYTTQERSFLTSEKVFDDVVEDITQIKVSLGEMYPNFKIVPYICMYKNINKTFPNAAFKEPTTKIQNEEVTICNGAISALLEHYEETKEELFKEEWMLSSSKRCVLLTHLPLDLISIHKFSELGLLESHTGVIKTRSEWWTKLHVKKTGPIIPFHKTMLEIFGDGPMFKPQPIKIRKYLLGLSERKGWNTTTTMDKIRSDVKLDNEPYALEFINRYR